MTAVNHSPTDRTGAGSFGAPRRPSLPPPTALAVKAEVVFGVLLVVRHRAVRLGATLVLAVIGLAVAAGGPAAGSVFIVGGSLAAVAASRPLAPGPALAAAHRAAGPWWLAPVGRLTAVLLVIAPFLLMALVLVAAPRAGWPAALTLGLVAIVYAAGLGALTLGLAPLMGASGAATAGLLAAWFGGLGPSAVAAALRGWPVLARPLVVLWNLLPLEWRALRWLEQGRIGDGLLLLGWIAGGLLLAAWAAGAAFRGTHGPEAP